MLEELKDEIDVEMFLQTMGVKKIRKSSQGYQVSCLNPLHRDSSPSLMYRYSTQKFKCYGCDFSGDIIDVVQIVKNLNFKKAITWLREYVGWTSTASTKELEAIIDRREKNKSGEFNTDAQESIIMPSYFQSDFSFAGDLIADYLDFRKWDIPTLEEYGVGFCEHGYFKNRVIFPVFDASGVNLKTFVARAADREEEIRYLYPTKSLLSESIWPLNVRLENSIPIFVEGAPDALRLREYGYNAYACLGNQLGEVKLDIIRDVFKRTDEILVIPDGDRGGEDLLKWFGNLVHQFKITVGVIPKLDDVKDIDDMGKLFGREKIDYLIKNRKPYQQTYIDDRFSFKKPPSIVTDIVGEKMVSSSMPHTESPIEFIEKMFFAPR